MLDSTRRPCACRYSSRSPPAPRCHGIRRRRRSAALLADGAVAARAGWAGEERAARVRVAPEPAARYIRQDRSSASEKLQFANQIRA